MWFVVCWFWCSLFFFFQAEDGIRDLVRSRGLGDVYKRQVIHPDAIATSMLDEAACATPMPLGLILIGLDRNTCLLYTSDAADERSSVDLGGRRIIKKKNTSTISR